jgi:hypothetical protein
MMTSALGISEGDIESHINEESQQSALEDNSDMISADDLIACMTQKPNINMMQGNQSKSNRFNYKE